MVVIIDRLEVKVVVCFKHDRFFPILKNKEHLNQFESISLGYFSDMKYFGFVKLTISIILKRKSNP